MSKAEDEQQARLERAREIGLFRYMLIREAADATLTRRQRGAMVRAVAARSHTDPFGRVVTLTRWTLDRWIAEWRRSGFDALVPSPNQSQPRTICVVVSGNITQLWTARRAGTLGLGCECGNDTRKHLAAYAPVVPRWPRSAKLC